MQDGRPASTGPFIALGLRPIGTVMVGITGQVTKLVLLPLE
jgi:hypothetical protein